MSDLKSIKILGSTTGHAPTRAKLAETFDVITSDLDTVKNWPIEKRAEIRGIASLFVGADKALIDALPNLEIISSFGVGYDHIDANHAAKQNVIVTHTPDVLDDEVADTTIGLLINTLRELYQAEKYLRDGHWEKQGSYPLTSLSMRNRSVGIFGLGRIGQTIAKRLSGFDVPIHYHSRNPVAGAPFTYHQTLVGMAQAVDTLIAIVPGTAQTHHSINADVLKALGPRGVLINVARGPVVDEAALIEALQNKTIAAAGLDVFEREPSVPQALIDMKNVSLLPHVASASEDTRMLMGNLVYDNLVAWFMDKKVISSTPETKHLVKS
ncbi:MAG: 2-hydroxyacid dehydrogenase [Ahrensia sp.]|nr:2-hydroxyacid dehydrogenase [Ahrensia sp.]